MLVPILILALASDSVVRGALPDTIPFASAEAGGYAGGVAPVGSLARNWEPGARAGLRATFSHWNSVRTRVDLEGAVVGGKEGDDATYFLGTTGFEWRPGMSVIECGAGLGLFYVRTKSLPGRARLTDGGESEFGLVLRGGWRAWESGPWVLRLEGSWETAFTRPEASMLGSAGVSVARRIW